jgi:DNA-binding NarL/FixJ family response regulator
VRDGRDASSQREKSVGVLIVDDQAPFRAAVGRLVGLLKGWRVVAEAATGEQALATFAEVSPDVVVMDINLPGISGIEATRRIVESAPAAAVVLVSTYAEGDLPADAHACGAVAYMRKDDLTPRLLQDTIGR